MKAVLGNLISFLGFTGVAVLANFLKLPIIAFSSSAQSFAQFLWWTTALTALPILAAGATSRGRLTGEVPPIRFRAREAFRITTLGVSVVTITLFFEGSILVDIWMVLLLFLFGAGMFVGTSQADLLGVLQKRGKAPLINLASTIGVVASFAVTVVGVASSTWSSLKTSQQMTFLVAASVASFLTPYLLAMVMYKVEKHANTERPTTNPHSSFVETLGALPPLLLALVSTMAVSWFIAPEGLAEYNFGSRLASILNLVPAALFSLWATKINSSPEQVRIGVGWATCLKLSIMNLPMIGGFLLFSELLSAHLSAGQVHLTPTLVIGLVVLSQMQIVWMTISNIALPSHEIRQKMSRFNGVVAIPTALLLSLALGYAGELDLLPAMQSFILALTSIFALRLYRQAGKHL